jgi:hypothetical protein
MSAVAANATAKMVVWNSDTALAAIASGGHAGTAMTALRSASQYAVYSKANNNALPVSWTVDVSPDNLGTNGKYILLGVSCLNTGQTCTVTTLRSGTTRPSAVTFAANDTTATGGLFVTPLENPFTTVTGSSTATAYLGLLRCDV